VKFISVLGGTGAGKTVYLSRLLAKMVTTYFPQIGWGAQYLTNNEKHFVEKNDVSIGKPLPAGTTPGKLTQPLFYDASRGGIGDRSLITTTFVLYDIAGEDCDTEDKMRKHGTFVLHSDGVILLVDPAQLGLAHEVRGGEPPDNGGDPTDVMVAISVAVAGESKAETECDIPIAVCISKGDLLAQEFFGSPALESVSPIRVDDRYESTFNAEDYNRIQERLRTYIVADDSPFLGLQAQLVDRYSHYNYFIVSALGTGVRPAKDNDGNEIKDEHGNVLTIPVGPPNPKRIEEPLYWLLHEFGYLGTNAPINPPPGVKRSAGKKCRSKLGAWFERRKGERA
jgi:hypothetical protein